jgi:tetratricopeptide (TPR) repeat protein
VPVPISEPSTGPSVARAENPWEDLSVAAAPFPAAAEDELVFRSDEAGDAAFTSAMAPYRQGDYAAAEVALERFLASHPGEGRALFYRGVSLLLLGRAEAAIPPLASAASASPAPEDARWYLALARLKSGDRGGALRDLDMVADAPGARRQEAATLAKEVRDALDDRGR